LRDGIWTIPSERSKNHRALVLPLARQGREAVDAWPRIVGRDPLFGRSAIGFQGWSVRKRALDVRLAFATPWSLHDLRRTTQTRLRGLGIDRDLVNRVLNHAMGPIDEAYDLHSYEREKRDALQKWADALDRITGPEHANVFPLDERRQAS
jgi:integrase